MRVRSGRLPRAAWWAAGACFAVLACSGPAVAKPAGEAAPSVVLPAPDLQTPRPVGLVASEVPPRAVEARALPPAGAPSVIVVLLDDVGFGAAGTFGGPIPTPTLDHLAKQGLRYNRFHTTAICSPTRASLLTGRNPHAVNVGAVLNVPSPYPGYEGVLPKSAATVAEVLRQNGYNTSAWGKWHLTPAWESSPVGPFERWPTSVGFEKFYGFLGGETHQFEPTLHEGTTPVQRPDRPNYHLSEDLAERAVAWMRLQHALEPERPFFVYFAPGATHAPLHVAKPWIERFRGHFDQGWDQLREEIFARQKRLGVIPPEAELTPRPQQLPAWSSLGADRRRIAARLMEVYAGFLAHTDAQVGKLLDAVEEMDELDNTLVFYIVGDNGASGEGGLYGTWNEMGNIQGVRNEPAVLLERLDEIGGPDSYPHFNVGWAWALDTPFQWFKQVASHLGGTRNPLVVSWPTRITDRGGLRRQFSHVADVAPTILEAAGIPAPAVVNGVAQQPLDGTSLVYSFDDANAPSRRRTQYFEVFGNRALYHEGWMASAFHGRLPWILLSNGQRAFDADRWELYHLDADFSQASDLAKQEPEKLRRMQDLFLAEAARNQVLPLQDATRSEGLPDPSAGRTTFTFHAGAVGIAESSAPPVIGRSHTITAEIDVPTSGAHGVLVAEGGIVAGWSLYLDAEGRPAYAYNLFGAEQTTLVAPDSLPPGPAAVGIVFDYDGGGHGRGASLRLLVDGLPVAEARLGRTVPVFFSIDESFDVGLDSGSPAGPYRPDNAFSGELRRVVVELR